MPARRSPNPIPSESEGIVTILGADTTKPGSIRRTLSADMSSKKWLQQNGFFSPIKKIVSSQQIALPNQDQVWNSIQADKDKNQTPGVWGLILTQKSDNSPLQQPYIHPMVKRSTSGLSDKSLEVCTESLGSETGSDSCFSSCPTHADDQDRDDDISQRNQDDPFADLHVAKYKNSPPRPFPPPLPSISAGAALQMHSHRHNGRLVLEAVSVAPKTVFHARRHDGRLLLTLDHAPEADEEETAPEVVQLKSGGGGKEEESLVEKNLCLPSGMISVHKSGLVMKKLMAVGNINPKWGNDVAVRGDGGEISPQSLPPRPRAGRLSFNDYEYFWRSEPGFMISRSVQESNRTEKTEQRISNKMNQELVMYMRGCKEKRRSLIWEKPYCIATS